MTYEERQIDCVLVHGTFARNAAWTNSVTSPLCAALREQLDNSVSFRAFEWSGRNSHRARRTAADQLAAFVSNRHVNGHSTVRVLIGHSHGGTVICDALKRHKKLLASVDYVVLLSTPFIQARVPPHFQAMVSLLNGISRLALGIGIWFVSAALLLKLFTNDSGGILSFSFLFPLGVVLLGLGMFFLMPSGSAPNSRLVQVTNSAIIDRFIRALGDRRRLGAAERVARYLQQFSLTELPSERCLIVRSNADEASALLAAGQFFTWLVHSVQRLLIRVSQTIFPMFVDYGAGTQDQRPWYVRLGTVISTCFAVAVVVAILSANIWQMSRLISTAWIEVVVFGLTELIVGSIFIYSATLIVLLLMLGLAAILFGIRPSLTSLFVEYSVESTPPGQWHLYRFDLIDTSEGWARGESAPMAHSQSYENPQALKYVCAWINAQLRERGRAGDFHAKGAKGMQRNS